MSNTLFYGDNLDVLRERVADASVDLIYLDPPFNSNATYNVLFRAPAGQRSEGQIEAFQDTWHWGPSAARAFDAVLESQFGAAASVLVSLRRMLGESDMMAYLAMMAVRLLELHRALKPTGSLYLHCDPTASHYLKILLDGVFGPERFLNEIVWKRTGAHGGARRWGPIHDTLMFYTKGDDYTWNRVFQDYRPEYVSKQYRFRDERGSYRLVTLTGAGKRTGDSGAAWRGINPTKVERHWAVPRAALERAYPDRDLDEHSTQEKLELLDAAGLVYWPSRGTIPQQKR